MTDFFTEDLVIDLLDITFFKGDLMTDLVTGLAFFTPSCWDSAMIESFLTTWSRVSLGFFFVGDIVEEIFDDLIAANNCGKFIAGRWLTNLAW